MNDYAILIVDDDIVTIKLIEKVLKKNGFAFVAYAKSGNEAIDKLASRNFDIILMDIHLGQGMDGIDTAFYFLEHSNIPTIFISAQMKQDDIERVVRSGVYAFLAKPINEKDLVVAINIVLHRHQERMKSVELLCKVQNKLSANEKDLVFALDIALQRHEERMKSQKLLREAQNRLQSAQHNLSYLQCIKRFHTGVDAFEKSPLIKDESAHPIGIGVFDIDGLSNMNNYYGHENGDKILRVFMEFLEQIHHECSVARIGDDGFTLLVPKADDGDMEIYLKILSEKCLHDKTISFQWSYSAGYAIKEKLHSNINETYNLAERRMNVAKLISKNSIRSSIIDTVLATFISKTKETKEHCMRMKNLAWEYGNRLALRHHKKVDLALLAILHDIGKIGIPETILMKENLPHADEWDIIRTHSEIGGKMAASIDACSHLSNDILCLHENWDGSGYPSKLSGYEIPENARMMAIIDAYDAMTNDRCYRRAMSVDKALEELEESAGRQFDPILTNEFIQILKEKKSLIKREM